MKVFSLAYTSVRPRSIPEVVKLWNDRCHNQSACEWVIATDEGDEASKAAAEACSAWSKVPVKVVVNTGSKDSTSGWNCACAATTGKVLIAISDDFLCPEAWDAKLLELQPPGWENGEHAVHVEDDYGHTLMVLPIITRARYERFGYLYYPKYRSLFADTELTDTAYRDGVVIGAHHLLFEHLHPDCGKRQRDKIDLVHGSKERWNSGEMIYNFRKARGFPLDDGPKAVQEVVDTSPPHALRFAVYMQVTQDDLCLQEVCNRLHEEGLRDFFFSVPDRYWSGEAVPEEKAATLKPVFERLIAQGCNVQIKNFNLNSYRMGSETRIVLETRVRNDSLAWIRKQGFEDILIVDGDELWFPGTLELIKPFVEQGHSAVSVRMIPVMGNPGYPVDAALDAAVVYIGKNCNFRACRTPTAQQAAIQQPLIIHFTATRRTLDDNIAKHRRSGHYDDPDYAFEDWIQTKLPNAKPGLLDAHMYTQVSIWPSLREWRPEELAIIPATLHGYLGRKN